MVVELLYAFAMGNERIFDFADELLGAKKIRNAQADFAKGLFKGVVAHLQHIDSVIKAHLKSWELSRLGVIDKCILRLGVYEILKGEIDAPVAINEAIEIAKILGAENTGRFVNGVLDAINKQNSSCGGGNSPLGLHSADLANRHKARTQSPLSLCPFTKNHESQTENPSVVDSAESAESSEKNAESTLDSTIPQNLAKSTTSTNRTCVENAYENTYENAYFESIQVFPPTPKHCIFEFVYFARPDSVVFNKSVYEIRKNMGVQLAREYKIKADFVIPVPDSGVISALGYAQESGIPFEFGIVRNHYIGRTFIEPTQKSRELKVKLKLNPISRLLQGKEIIVIDDSVVRGTTSKQIISILRKAGAKKVHLVIASPQTIAPCYYGVDTPDCADLICANKNLSEVCEFIGADSLHFLSLNGLYKSIGVENGECYCKACFDGEYII